MFLLFLIPFCFTDWDLSKMVHEINNRNDVGWTARVNPHFKSFNQKKFRSLNSAQHNPSFSLQFKNEFVKIEDEIPESFDARTNWPNCPTIGHIYDQGHCGSCWAMCSFEVLQDRFCIHSNGSEKPWLSGQDITSCDSRSHGCNGGWTETAFEYAKKAGVPTEECVPYLMGKCHHPGCSSWQTPTCKKECSSLSNYNYSSNRYYASKSYSIQRNVEAIQLELMRNGPVTAVFTTYDDLAVYWRGVYNHVMGSEQGLHAIKIVGWGVWRESEHMLTEEEKKAEEEKRKRIEEEIKKEKREDKWHDFKQNALEKSKKVKRDETKNNKEEGIPYWIIVNSWGEDFGMDGILLIKRGVNECGIESDVYTGIPKIEKKGWLREREIRYRIHN